ncbi:hypothetical protein SH601_15040 [Gracilibacillus sp. S3-1-1]|uniref:Uncharacterized protein n=1 Tax=Gracilibacillus pellucidus TaxID=3095368 RepID=A0ACC6M8I9_9BACI|nr:hypothetical protein [Gracilibacillus sp. S3-1-1]MDX8047284.1 hypothetical protein [Gracilibacillus sp. S3-1-1]
MLVFSATLPETVEAKAEEMMHSPEVIRVGTEDDDRPNVAYMYLVCEARDSRTKSRIESISIRQRHYNT